jgi:hypothetical protein
MEFEGRSFMLWSSRAAMHKDTAVDTGVKKDNAEHGHFTLPGTFFAGLRPHPLAATFIAF